MKLISVDTRLNAMILWALALWFLLAGFFLSKYQFLDQLWLSRAGCLIVVLGIWSSVGGLIQERIILESLNFRRQMIINSIWRKHWSDDEEREQMIAQVNARFDKRIEEAERRTEMSVGILEASLLLTGTLFWGFGGLIQYI